MDFMYMSEYLLRNKSSSIPSSGWWAKSQWDVPKTLDEGLLKLDSTVAATNFLLLCVRFFGGCFVADHKMCLTFIFFFNITKIQKKCNILVKMIQDKSTGGLQKKKVEVSLRKRIIWDEIVWLLLGKKSKWLKCVIMAATWRRSACGRQGQSENMKEWILKSRYMHSCNLFWVIDDDAFNASDEKKQWVNMFANGPFI